MDDRLIQLIESLDASLGFGALKIYAMGGCSPATDDVKDVANLALHDINCRDLRLTEDGKSFFLLSERVAFFNKMHELRKLPLDFKPVKDLRDIMVEKIVGTSTNEISFEEAENKGFCLLWRDDYCSVKDVNVAIREKKFVDARKTLKQHREVIVKKLNYPSSCTLEEKETMKGLIVNEIHTKGFALLENGFSFPPDPGHLLCIVDLINDLETRTLPLNLFPCQCLANFWILKNHSCVISNQPTSLMYLSQLFVEILLHTLFLKAQEAEETNYVDAKDAEDEAAEDDDAEYADAEAAEDEAPQAPRLHWATQSDSAAYEVKKMIGQAIKDRSSSDEKEYARILAENEAKKLASKKASDDSMRLQQDVAVAAQKEMERRSAIQLQTKIEDFYKRAMYNFNRKFGKVDYENPDTYYEVEEKCKELGIEPFKTGFFHGNPLQDFEKLDLSKMLEYCEVTPLKDRGLIEKQISYLLQVRKSMSSTSLFQTPNKTKIRLILGRIALLLNNFDGAPMDEDIISKEEFDEELNKQLEDPEIIKYIKDRHFQSRSDKDNQLLVQNLWIPSHNNLTGYFSPHALDTRNYVEDKVRKNIYDRRLKSRAHNP